MTIHNKQYITTINQYDNDDNNNNYGYGGDGGGGGGSSLTGSV